MRVTSSGDYSGGCERVGLSRFEHVNEISAAPSSDRLGKLVKADKRAGVISGGAKALIVGVMVALVALAGCSSTESLTLDSTCAEYFELPSDERRDELNQLGVANGWIGAGNPLYLANFEASCGQSPSRSIGSVLDVD